MPKAFQLSREVPTARLPCRVVKPHQRNPNYVGRGDIRSRLQQRLAPRSNGTQGQQRYALCGLGGVGKTQTALNYVFEYIDSFQAVLWAHADTRAKLLESYANFAIDLGLINEGDSNLTGRDLLKKWFEDASMKALVPLLPDAANRFCYTAVPWLLVLDNADSDDKQAIFDEFWPRGPQGSVLITSRDTTLQASIGGEILTGLTKESAFALLVRLTKPRWQEVAEERSSHEEQAAYDIVSRVGYLPLGITQAAEIIIKDSCLLSEFLIAYNDRELIEGADLVTSIRRPDETYPLSLSTVWNMSFESLNDEQQMFLNVISFLDPDRIQLQLLTEGAATAVKNGIQSLAFMDHIRKLVKLKGPVVRSALVTQNEKLRELWMHRLVQQSCHSRMTFEDRQDSFDKACWVVKTMWPVPERNNRHRVDLWPTQQAYFAHVQSLAHFYSVSVNDDNPLKAGQDFAELLTDASL